MGAASLAAVSADAGERILPAVREVVGPAEGLIPLHEPEFCGWEREYLAECIETGRVSSVGAFVDRIERDIADYTGVARAIAVVDGTAALHICLQRSGVVPGDEVLVPALTFVATANAVACAEAVPHFVDSERETLAVCADRLEVHRRLREGNLLVIFHASALDGEDPVGQLEELPAALDTLGEETQRIFTMPNADTGGRGLIVRGRDYADARPNVAAFASLGQRGYFSLLALVDSLIGNSSSGPAEAPTFEVGTLNIGERQAGWHRAASVIDCAPRRNKIKAVLKRLFSDDFRAGLANVWDPCGNGGASRRIGEALRTEPLDRLLKRKFHDLSSNSFTMSFRGIVHG